ncbi:GGDEF domain-containing protein [Streptomyces sp. NBC_01725]|uniref:GGDEF domain-containing protein n=1 Tax=Streptomyces sp. NBC_01725 TaxID=2975923 RepID=UPI002E2B5E67|nr:GGDEF domain-containing protein [Streptomyces sp. NBC_01725]
MSSSTRVQGRIGPRTLLITTAAIPLAGWIVHAVALHRRIATTKRDPLTGLLRRDAYTARVRRILARRRETALVWVDADHFKQINDSFGHAAGDAVLAAIGTRLTAWAGPRAAISRLGGDGFAVVLELRADQRTHRLEQLVRMLRTPVALDDGRSLDVAASVGSATPDAIGSRDLTALQRAAAPSCTTASTPATRSLRPPSTPTFRPSAAAAPDVRVHPRGGRPHEHHDPPAGG